MRLAEAVVEVLFFFIAAHTGKIENCRRWPFIDNFILLQKRCISIFGSWDSDIGLRFLITSLTLNKYVNGLQTTGEW